MVLVGTHKNKATNTTDKTKPSKLLMIVSSIRLLFPAYRVCCFFRLPIALECCCSSGGIGAASHAASGGSAGSGTRGWNGRGG